MTPRVRAVNLILRRLANTVSMGDVGEYDFPRIEELAYLLNAVLHGFEDSGLDMDRVSALIDDIGLRRLPKVLEG